MTDDIVTRLRDIASLRGDLAGHVIPLACLNAADEIERLVALLTMASVMAVSHPDSIAFAVGQNAVIEWAKTNKVLLEEGAW